MSQHPIVRRAISFLKNNADLSELFRGGTISLILKLFSGFMGFLTSLAVARLIGAESAGLYFLGVSLLGLVSAFSRLGTDAVLSRHISTAVDEGNGRLVDLIYRRTIRIVALSAIIVSVLMAVTSGQIAEHVFSKPELGPVLLLLSLAVTPHTLSWLHGSAFLGFSRIVLFQLFRRMIIGLGLLAWLGVALLVQPEIDLTTVLICYLLSAICAVTAGYLFWSRREPLSDLESTPSEVYSTRGILKSASPMLGSVMLNNLSGRMGQLLIGIYQSSIDVAHYAVSQQIAGLSSVILTAMNTASFPRIARLYKRDDIQGIQRVTTWMTRLVVVTCTPVVLILAVLGEWVLGMFGPGFEEAILILWILLAGQFVNIVTGIVGITLNACGHGKLLLRGTTLGFVTTLGLCLVLIPEYGILGAAIANATGSAALNLSHTFWVKRRLGFFVGNIFARV